MSFKCNSNGQFMQQCKRVTAKDKNNDMHQSTGFWALIDTKSMWWGKTFMGDEISY